MNSGPDLFAIENFFFQYCKSPGPHIFYGETLPGLNQLKRNHEEHVLPVKLNNSEIFVYPKSNFI